MGTLAQHSYRRHSLYKTHGAAEADRIDLQVCQRALNELNKSDKNNITEMAEELSEGIRSIGPDTALRLLGAVGRYLAQNPAYIQARIEGKVKPNGS